MRRRKGWGAAALLAASCGLAAPAGAQTPGQHARIDQLARYVVETAFCPRLGVPVAIDPERFETGLQREAVRSSLYFATAERALDEALQRRRAEFETDLARDLGEARPKGRAVLAADIERRGQVCLEAADDPLFSAFVRPPVGFDLPAAAKSLAAKILQPGEGAP